VDKITALGYGILLHLVIYLPASLLGLLFLAKSGYSLRPIAAGERRKRVFRMKAAIVHDFFCNLGGSDQVAAALHRLYPEAPVYTLLVSDRNREESLLQGMNIKPSFVQRLPMARRRHEVYCRSFLWPSSLST